MINEIKKEAEEKMKHSIEYLGDEFKGIRTGRANIAILDTIKRATFG